MGTLAIGDHVSDLVGTRDGRLVEIDGETGYVLQANGVEIEFPLARLRPYRAPEVAQVRTLSGPLRDRRLSDDAARLLASVPAELLAAIARSYEAGPGPSGAAPVFASLPDSKRLEIIRIYLPSLPRAMLARHTALVVAMRDLARPGR